MPEMSDHQLLAILDQEFESSMGGRGTEVSQERADAYDYYLGKPFGNEIEGQSQVVSSDVSEVVDGLMPSLLRLFTTADNLVSFDPVGDEDAAKAAQESDYVNHVFFKENPAFMIMYSWFFDALVQKNGIVKAWWDDSEVVTYETYENLSEDEVTELLNDEELEPVSRDSRIIETVADGRMVEAEVYDIQFRRVCKSGRAVVDNVPPEEFRVSADARSLDPSKARMVGQERDIKRSDLVDMGFDKDVVEKLPSTLESNQDSDEKISRYDKSEETVEGSHDRSQDMIEVREAYMRIDYDGDGRSELRQIFVSGNEILSNEPIDRQPFHVICPKPLPHKFFGIAKSEDVMDIELITSTLERQILDNLYQTNNPETNVWEQAMGETTMDDLLTRRVGKINRFARPVAEATSQNIVPFTAGATFPMLEFYDKRKRDRTGISSDSEGLSAESLKNIQQSVLTQALDIAKQKVELVARVFSETGIKSLFLHIHELLLKHQKKSKIVRLREQFVKVDPQSWRTRFDMTISIGLGIGSREQNLLHLESIWTKQVEMVKNGGLNLLVTPDNMYNTAAEVVKNSNRKNPDMFFTNPRGKAAPEQSDQQLQFMQEQLKLQQKQQEIESREQALNLREQDLRHQRELDRLRLEKEMHDDDVGVKLEKIENDFVIAMEKIANELAALNLKEEA